MHRQIWFSALSIALGVALVGCAGGLDGGGADGGAAGAGGVVPPPPEQLDFGKPPPGDDQGPGGQGGAGGQAGVGGQGGSGGAAGVGGQGGAAGVGGQGGAAGDGGEGGAAGVGGQGGGTSGQPCSDLDDCVTDACLDFGAGRICVELCSNGRCPDDFVCHQSGYCIPEDGAGGAGGVGGQGGAGGVMMPPLDCAGLSDCVDACGPDEPCADACQMRAPAPDQMAYDAWIGCAQSNGCSLVNRDCLLLECAAETDACLGPRPDANSSCQDFINCRLECEDAACLTACAEQTTAEALSTFDVFADCATQEMCQTAACERAQCGPELEACLPGLVYPQGNENCAQFNDCLGTCGPNNQPCVDNCIRRTSPQGYLNLIALIDCDERTMCNASRSCPAQCPNEWNACFP